MATTTTALRRRAKRSADAFGAVAPLTADWYGRDVAVEAYRRLWQDRRDLEDRTVRRPKRKDDAPAGR